MQNDLLADALTRIRNSIYAGKNKTKLRFSKKVHSILQILVQEKFLHKIEEVWEKNQHLLVIYLSDKRKVTKKAYIHHLEIVSRPGRRIYVNKKNIPRILGGVGIAIISTSKGILSSRHLYKNSANDRQSGPHVQLIGGEVLCFVW